MWYKYLIIAALFYLSALLQNSFLAHFRFFGSTLNLIFAIFFVFIFFVDKKINLQIIFYSIAAGFFTDIFFHGFFGAAIISFMAVGFLAKRLQSMLAQSGDKYPFIHFLALFSAGFCIYGFLVMLPAYLFDSSHKVVIIDVALFLGLVFNTAFASIIFYFYKKISGITVNNRQLSLFS